MLEVFFFLIIISSELSFCISPLSKHYVDPSLWCTVTGPTTAPLAQWRAGVWILCGILKWNHKCPHDNNKILNLCDIIKKSELSFIISLLKFFEVLCSFQKECLSSVLPAFKNHYLLRQFSNRWKITWFCSLLLYLFKMLLIFLKLIKNERKTREELKKYLWSKIFFLFRLECSYKICINFKLLTWERNVTKCFSNALLSLWLQLQLENAINSVTYTLWRMSFKLRQLIG